MKKIVICFLIIILVPVYYIYLSPRYLPFSDAAKFADIARNIVGGYGYTTNFVFPGNEVVKFANTLPFYQPWQPPIVPFLISLAFRLFGANDVSVILVSGFFYIASVFLIFFLGRLLYGKSVGLLASTIFAFSSIFLGYATSGASESVFIFEIILLFYLLSIEKKYSLFFGFLFCVFLYFTRPQAFIYIMGAVFFWLLLRNNIKKASEIFLLILFIGLFFDYIILGVLNGRYFLYSITSRGINAFSSVASDQSPTVMLSGGMTTGFNPINFSKKVFYNLYNFYKLIPQIMNPYLFAFFLISLFRWGKDKVINALKISTIFMVGLTFLVTAATIPFFRYLHPVVPLIYLFAIETLVWITGKIYDEFKSSKLKIKKELFINALSFSLVFIFSIGLTLGVIFLDSRFERNTHNVGKPPIYAKLSWILRDNTLPDDVTVTNLDTWGSWYGERKTVWFPLEPKQLVDPETGKIPFDSIYLTSYLMNDENYYMGESWRQIFNNPEDSSSWICDGCEEIAKEYTLKGVYNVPANENYQKEDAKAILLVKK